MSIRTEVESITPDRAQFFLNNSSYFGQRKTNDSRVDFYAIEMLEGRFLPTNQIAFAYLLDKAYLINGYHTLKAIIKSGKTCDLVVIYHTVQNELEIAKLYEHYDIGMVRTPTHQDKPFGIFDLLGVTHGDWNKIRPALKFIAFGYPQTNVKVPVAAELFRENALECWKDEIGLLFDTYSSCSFYDGDYMRTRVKMYSVISVFLPILKYDAVNAVDFIYQVCMDDKLEKGDPRKRAHTFLRFDVNNTGKKRYTSGYIARNIAKFWNYWIDGKEVFRWNSITATELRNNIIIENTPLDGTIETLDFMSQLNWKNYYNAKI